MHTTWAPDDDVQVLVLLELITLCKKIAENPTVKKDLRVQAIGFVTEGNSLVPCRGRSTNLEHFEGEKLLSRIARFLPRDEKTSVTRRFIRRCCGLFTGHCP